MIKQEIKVDSIITDLPYGTTNCKWDNIIPFNEMWLRLNKLIKPKGAIVLFGSEPFSSALRVSNIKNYKYDWIWNKRLGANHLNAKIQPMKIHENIIVFNKHNYYPIMSKGKMKKKGSLLKKQPEHTSKVNIDYSITNDLYYPKSILDEDIFSNSNRKRKRFHTTEKPVPLMEYLIKTYTKEDELVLDFTAGSGSTLVACINTNRDFIGFETDNNYYNIAKERIKEIRKNITT